MPDTPAPQPAPVTIKKYANRRLYNTATSSYVTLDNLATMVKEGTDFVVYDAKTGEDITRQVLTQIIVEEEGKGQNLLPISFLRQLIGFYGDNMQWLVPSYLETAMRTFARNQEQMRQYMQTTFGGMFPFGGIDELGKQNMAMFERAMKMFSPFPGDQPPGTGPGTGPGMGGLMPGAQMPSPTSIADARDTVEQLRLQMEALQQQLNRLMTVAKGPDKT